jgi:hypothetical protein
MTARRLFALSLLATAGCGETVHVRLEAGDCDPSGIPLVLSLYVEMTRTDEKKMTSFYIPCKDTQGLLSDIGELEALLGSYPPFDDVPPGGVWNLWVIGYDTTCDAEDPPPAPLLCGKAAMVTIPPPDNEIRVEIDCKDKISDSERIEMIKEQLRSCQLGIYPRGRGEPP